MNEILKEMAAFNRDAAFVLDRLLETWEPNSADLAITGTFGMHKIAKMAGWSFVDINDNPVPFDGSQAKAYHYTPVPYEDGIKATARADRNAD